MFKFDVKYTYDNYYEYYKFVLIKQRLLKDILFFVLFVAVAVYWWVAPDTDGNLIPILSLVFACGLPLMNFITIPLIKKQLRQRQEDIDRTHIAVTFNEDDILYENLTEDPYENNKPLEVKDEEVDASDIDTLNESPVSNTEEVTNQEKVVEDEKTFVLKYANFLIVRESANLFMFYLDRQTVIIIPKETYIQEQSLEQFKNFILTKIDPKRVKFLKEKVEN